MQHLEIVSLSNPRIKNLLKLEKSNQRRKEGLYTVEGKKEILLCANAGYKITELYYCADHANVTELSSNKNFKDVQFIKISKQVFDKIAYRENRDGYIALVKAEYKLLSDLKLRHNPLIIVLESIEKPGNLGAILRTADAAHVDAVIVCDKKTDIFNANVIRSSIGCVFTNQVVTCTNDECITWLKNNHIKIYAAALTATKFYHHVNYTNATAILLGTEADGLSQQLLAAANEQIKIPMNGKIDSLNVSASCSIITFEAMRQRDFKF